MFSMAVCTLDLPNTSEGPASRWCASFPAGLIWTSVVVWEDHSFSSSTGPGLAWSSFPFRCQVLCPVVQCRARRKTHSPALVCVRDFHQDRTSLVVVCSSGGGRIPDLLTVPVLSIAVHLCTVPILHRLVHRHPPSAVPESPNRVLLGPGLGQADIASTIRPVDRWIETLGCRAVWDLPLQSEYRGYIGLVDKDVRFPHVTMDITTLTEFPQGILEVMDAVCDGFILG